MAAADFCGSFARASNGSSTTNTAPELGALVNVAPEKPTKLAAWTMPGTWRAVSTARRFTSSVRASGRRRAAASRR